MTKTVYSTDGKDYTYSWFKIALDFKTVPQGDYNIYIKAESEDYFVSKILNNRLYRNEATYYYNNKKYVTIKNEYGTNLGALLFTIRDNKLASKTAGFTYNQYGSFRTFEIKNNKLHVVGTSYSYGMNLDKNQSVKREIIFENISTYETYRFDLGSITTGPYEVALPESDNLSKTRAWFDNSIDLSKVAKGTYVIYVTTTSNITDIGIMSERMGKDLSGVILKQNGKTYTFSINSKYNKRIEMKVS